VGSVIVTLQASFAVGRHDLSGPTKGSDAAKSSGYV
jgi:hypothetical protein